MLKSLPIIPSSTSKRFTYYSYFILISLPIILISLPIIPILFFCINNAGIYMYY